MSVKFYVSNLTFFFVSVSAAEPKYVKISMDGKDISDSRIGPYNEGQELRLLCESGGGKPIPRVTWYNGSEKLSGMFLFVLVWIKSNELIRTMSIYDYCFH